MLLSQEESLQIQTKRRKAESAKGHIIIGACSRVKLSSAIQSNQIYHYPFSLICCRVVSLYPIFGQSDDKGTGF